MRRLVIKQNETGFATVIVIILIVVMGLLLAGLIPLGTTVTQSAAYTRNALQAQYIAEAGAKRAIAALSSATATTSWTWLDGDPWHNISVNPNVESQYRVNITTPGGVTLNGTPPVGTYGITSRGQYGNFSKTVTVQVEVTDADFSNLNADFVVGGDVETTKSTANIQSNGDMTVVGKVADNITKSGDISKKGHVTTDAKITIPSISSYFDALMAKRTKKFWSALDGQSLKLTDKEQIYYYDKDEEGTSGLVISSNDKLSEIKGLENKDEYTLVVVNGDLTFKSDVSGLNQNGNVIFVINGELHIDSNDVSLRNCCFFCVKAEIGNANADGNSNFTGKLVVENDLVLNSSLNNSNPADFEKLDDYFKNLVGDASITVSNWAKGT
jgi:hypothetical protein